MHDLANANTARSMGALLTCSQQDAPALPESKGLPSQLLDVQRRLLECALRQEGIDAVLDEALSWSAASLGVAECMAVVLDENGLAHARASACFPQDLLAALIHVAAQDPAPSIPDGPELPRASRLHHQVRRLAEAYAAGENGSSRFWVEPILFDGQRSAGMLILRRAARAGKRGSASALSTLTASISLAVQVARRESNSRTAGETLASLTAAIPGVVYQRVVRPDGNIRYTYISESANDLFGVSATEIIANPEALFDRYSPDYRESFRSRLLEASRTLTAWDVEASILMPDGSEKFTHAIARPVRQADGAVVWTGVIMDASRIKKAEAALAAAEARTRQNIIESLSQGLLMFDANDRLASSNSHYFKLFPQSADVVQPGATYQDVMCAEAGHDPAVLPDERQPVEELALRLSKHGDPHHVFERQLSCHQWILVNEHRTPEGGTVVLYTDVTELKQRERRIHHIAHHDALTDLPNRIQFREKLSDALLRADRSGRPVAVLCLDLDHFKYVNDTLGHPMGDALLKIVGQRLTACLRGMDTAARLGGDEFAVIVPELPSPEFATQLAWRILEAIAQPVDIDGQQVLTAASVGIVISGSSERDSDTLIKNADLALYRAKADGRNTFRYFEPEMDAKAQARRAMEMDLRMAVIRNEIELHYQPIVNALTDEIVAFEALVRWTHPTRGAVTPPEFIGLAEETGLIKQLGEWILRRACSVAAGWPESVCIAVNLSAAQFRDRKLADVVLAILEETGLSPHRLELEITESLLLRDTDANLATLRQLKAAGISISMDDFGTGYSSLGNLRRFPFDKIKIDKSFINDLAGNPDSAAIVRSVISLGRSLGMGTIAEGVETREQLSRLRIEGCTEIQGFFFSKPRPAADVAKMLVDGVRTRGPMLAPPATQKTNAITGKSKKTKYSLSC